jgi:signal transduction histidine kinase
MEIIRCDNCITLVVEDDGFDFDPASVSHGMGLSGTRADACGGSLLID